MWLIKQVDERSILGYYQGREKMDIPELHSIPEPEAWESLVGGRQNRPSGPPSPHRCPLFPAFLIGPLLQPLLQHTTPCLHCLHCPSPRLPPRETPIQLKLLPEFPQEDQCTWFISFPPLIPFAPLRLVIICCLSPRAHWELPADSSLPQVQHST